MSQIHLGDQKNVLIRIPMPSTDERQMTLVKPHSFTPKGSKEEIFVEGHWRHASCIGKLAFQRNLFGISPDLFGKKILVDVNIFMKTTEKGGKSVLLLDIRPAKEPEGPQFKISFPAGPDGDPQVVFEEIQQPPQKQAVAA